MGQSPAWWCVSVCVCVGGGGGRAAAPNKPTRTDARPSTYPPLLLPQARCSVWWANGLRTARPKPKMGPDKNNNPPGTAAPPPRGQAPAHAHGQRSAPSRPLQLAPSQNGPDPANAVAHQGAQRPHTRTRTRPGRVGSRCMPPRPCPATFWLSASPQPCPVPPSVARRAPAARSTCHRACANNKGPCQRCWQAVCAPAARGAAHISAPGPASPPITQLLGALNAGRRADGPGRAVKQPRADGADPVHPLIRNTHLCTTPACRRP